MPSRSEASWSESLAAAQDSLVERAVGRARGRAAGRPAERQARPGQGAAAAALHESHLPERASGWVVRISSLQGRGEGRSGGGEAGARLARCVDHPSHPAQRPQRLLDRPEAIASSMRLPKACPAASSGGARSTTSPASKAGADRPRMVARTVDARLRDYYRVEDQAGRRYWIYREGPFRRRPRRRARDGIMHGLFG